MQNQYHGDGAEAIDSGRTAWGKDNSRIQAVTISPYRYQAAANVFRLNQCVGTNLGLAASSARGQQQMVI
jgi:hypothetical protein